ncbi:MAG: 3-methyl-2-oxobutanoate hydroxymethyltransferase [Phycisphaerae bacterium]
MPTPTSTHIDLAHLCRMKAEGRKFAMLTAYDYPTAVAAQAAGVHSLLIGDSMGCVVLGHENTRNVPLQLMLTLGEAVRRGAPNVYLVGDMPYESMVGGDEAALTAAQRFRDEAGCDAIKFEAESGHNRLVAKLSKAGLETIAHLGLRPQTVTSPEGYRAQARDENAIKTLVSDAHRMVDAGAAMLLLEAVPNEASQAVVSAVSVPVIGCGAGPACDAHVVVTHDLLGIGARRPPRFVPVLANVGEQMRDAMRCWVTAIEEETYPAPEHLYHLKKRPALEPAASQRGPRASARAGPPAIDAR